MVLLKAAFISLLATLAFALEKCLDAPTGGEYDYIVVGSGAGGGPLSARLAENGFSVLLIETGFDESGNPNTTSLLSSFAAIDGQLPDPSIDLAYTVNQFAPDSEVQRNDEWYPRAAGIGGCTIHNAGDNNIGALREQFDGLAQRLNDESWSRDNMQTYWALLERNLYLAPPNADHGFDGWLKTSREPLNFTSPDPAWQAIGDAVINASGPTTVEDINSHLPLPRAAHILRSTTGDDKNIRSSIRDKLVQVAADTDKLRIMTNTLATKVLLCEAGEEVVAYGVSVAAGAKLPVSHGFTGKKYLTEKHIVAKREVIISAGVFETPHLLMLSGIGDSEQLAQAGIPTVVHLPGVGSNLQDNDEVPVYWEFANNFTAPVSFGETLSSPANFTGLEADILTYSLPFEFAGFFHGMSVLASETANVFTAISLKAYSTSKGYVRLTGSHPQDPLDINKLRFQASGGRDDVAALRESVKRWREVLNNDPEIKKYLKREVAPGLNVTTDADLDQYVLKNVFGHHACCTAPIGTDDDPKAVLDGDFNVRGVRNLRVVDASVWPDIPGYAPTSPTYMLSEKAAQVIMRDAKVTVMGK
ncbi:choline dehydrogenase [Favolaschia claudopus]|uniref:Choline dehydrogenase n=1 Tax=Favolaschia claudopus TaxID=2862362 RepID=A0AAW0BDE1_9AGAR